MYFSYSRHVTFGEIKLNNLKRYFKNLNYYDYYNNYSVNNFKCHAYKTPQVKFFFLNGHYTYLCDTMRRTPKYEKRRFAMRFVKLFAKRLKIINKITVYSRSFN